MAPSAQPELPKARKVGVGKACEPCKGTVLGLGVKVGDAPTTLAAPNHKVSRSPDKDDSTAAVIAT